MSRHDGVLPWLLKDALGGNCRTTWLATVSPTAQHLDESLATLMLAQQAGKIGVQFSCEALFSHSAAANRPTVCKIHLPSMVAQLQREIEALRTQLVPDLPSPHSVELNQRLQAAEKLHALLGRPWDERLQETQAVQLGWQRRLRDCGILVGDRDDDEGPIGVALPVGTPYLLNFAGASAKTGLIYYIRDGDTLVSNPDATIGDDLPLIVDRTLEMRGRHVARQHCIIRSASTAVAAIPLKGADTLVNHQRIERQTELFTGDMLSFGAELDYCFQNPQEERPACTVARSFGSDTSLSTRHATSLGPRRSYEDDGRTGSSTFSSAGKQAQPIASGTLQPPSSASDNSDSRATSPSFSPYRQTPQRRSVIAAAPTDSERQQCRAEAVFACERNKESGLLTALITNMKGYLLEFKLGPAYALYFLIRGRGAHERDYDVKKLMSSIATLIKMRLQEAFEDQDLATVLFWLANTSELLAAVKGDSALVLEAGDLAVALTNLAEDAFSFFAEQVYARLRQAVPFILSESSIITSALSKISSGHDGPSHLQFVIAQLRSVHRLMDACLLSKFIGDQIFSYIFQQMGTLLFNSFVANPENFRWERALVIKFNLSRLSDFASAHGLKVVMERHLKHISQAVLLLQLNKTSLAHLDHICENCGSLNSVQIEHLLRNYRAGHDEAAVSADLISCIKARAMNDVDLECAEDEACGFRVQLLRVPAAATFHLAGAFHIQTGLVRPVPPARIAHLRGRTTWRRSACSRGTWPACSTSPAAANRPTSRCAPSMPRTLSMRRCGCPSATDMGWSRFVICAPRSPPPGRLRAVLFCLQSKCTLHHERGAPWRGRRRTRPSRE